MTLIQSKQIDRVLSAPVLIANHAIPAAGLNTDISGDIATALTSAGNNGTAVTDQISPDIDTEGVIVSGEGNRAEIYDAVTHDKLSNQGAEVYGRVTGSPGAYQLDFYYLDSGIETPHSLDASNIDFSFSYRYTFKDFPSESLVGLRSLRTDQDATAASSSNFAELVTVTATNTVDDLSTAPATLGVKLFINGYVAHTDTGEFTVIGTSITWDAATAGYDLEPTDTVIAEYVTA